MIKYFVHPGYVKSKSDGDEHYITAEQLIRLYRVNPAECKIILSSDDERGYDINKVKHLWPRNDGDYTLNN